MNEEIKLRTKTRKGWAAMNKGEFDIENISFLKTKREAVKQWGGRQVILPVTVTFYVNE